MLSAIKMLNFSTLLCENAGTCTKKPLSVRVVVAGSVTTIEDWSSFMDAALIDIIGE